MTNSKVKIAQKIVIVIVTILAIFPFLWMVVLSFNSNSNIIANPLSLPETWVLTNYINAIQVLDYPRLYLNTAMISIGSVLIGFAITFMSSFVISRMVFSKKMKKAIYGYLILGLSITPFILLFPVYRITTVIGLREQFALIVPYIATTISFNTLLLTGYLNELPHEIDEAAVVDGCNLWQLIFRITLPMAKPVIATVGIFNILYVWNEYPFASVMLRNAENFTLSMGTSFFKGTYNVDYGGIIASAIIIIIPQLIFYGVFQRKIVDGMTAGAVKG